MSAQQTASDRNLVESEDGSNTGSKPHSEAVQQLTEDASDLAAPSSERLPAYTFRVAPPPYLSASGRTSTSISQTGSADPKKPRPPPTTNTSCGASAATIAAVLGHTTDPTLRHPKPKPRARQDDPESYRGPSGSSSRWNVFGAPLTDHRKFKRSKK